VSQASLGQTVGVNQKRIARIEAAPGVTSFDQISRIVTALGGRLAIESGGDLATKSRITKTKRPSQPQATW